MKGSKILLGVDDLTPIIAQFSRGEFLELLQANWSDIKVELRNNSKFLITRDDRTVVNVENTSNYTLLVNLVEELVKDTFFLPDGSYKMGLEEMRDHPLAMYGHKIVTLSSRFGGNRVTREWFEKQWLMYKCEHFSAWHFIKAIETWIPQKERDFSKIDAAQEFYSRDEAEIYAYKEFTEKEPVEEPAKVEPVPSVTADDLAKQAESDKENAQIILVFFFVVGLAAILYKIFG